MNNQSKPMSIEEILDKHIGQGDAHLKEEYNWILSAMEEYATSINTINMQKYYVLRLRKGENIQRIVTYCGQKVREHIQLNKKAKGICWMRYVMPVNGDRSRAVLHNYSLSLKEVLNILSK
jgi:hypothetical protein